MKVDSRWQEQDGALCTEVECSGFSAAAKLVGDIAEIADNYNHHPDVCIHDYKFLRIALRTHDQDQVTDKDYQLAAAIDRILQ